jgi:hypothetical protein
LKLNVTGDYHRLPAVLVFALPLERHPRLSNSLSEECTLCYRYRR